MYSHSTLKTEYVWLMEFNSFEDVAGHFEKALYDYTNSGIHSAIGYMTTNEFHKNG